jgi:hypothetical protein
MFTLHFNTRGYIILRQHAGSGCGPGRSVGIATGYGLDGPEIESRWGRDFPHLSRPSLLYNGYRVFPGGKERSGRGADPSPSSNAVVMKE